MMKGEPFELGVNYWPRRKAMYWWSRFDRDEVREELEVIRSLGLTMVRVFLLWPDWQPAPDQVEPRMLERLHHVCQIADELELRLNVTFFVGHMSGPSWVPSWMIRRDQPRPRRVWQVVGPQGVVHRGYADPYTDPQVVAAEVLLLETVVGQLRDHPAIAVWNLGNEPDLFARPIDAAAGRAWARRMTEVIRGIDPSRPVTCGLHVASLVEDNGLRVHDVFAETDLAVMHGYPMYAPWARGPLDPDFVPFLCALTTALCGKPTLMEEFGGCTAAPGEPSTTWRWRAYGAPREQFMASERELTGYFERVLPRLVEVGALGALTWCFADYHPDLYDRPPCDELRHERYFGLVRPDGSLKPHAEAIRRFAESRPRVQPASSTVELDISPERFYRSPLKQARRLYQRFE